MTTVHPHGFDHRIDQRYVDSVEFGFVMLYDGTQETTIAFDGTNTFTLAPTGTVWHYYRNGVKYEVVGSKTATLSGSPPASAGTYYVYINGTDGTLTCDGNAWTLEDLKVPVATVVWNNTLTPKYWLADERHTCAISRRYHWEHHFSDGTEVVTFPTVAGYSVAPATPADADNTFSISASVISDEDLKITLAALTDPNGTATDYVTFYRTAAAAWSWSESAMPYKYGTYVQYDNAGTMTDIGNGDYVNSYLLLTNASGAARFAIVNGQAKFSTLAAAQGEQFSALTRTGIPLAEFVAVYQLTWYANSSYTTKGKCRLAATPARISVSASGASATLAATWGSITGTLANQTDLQAALDAKVAGPGSATDNAIVRFDATTGKLVQNSTVTIGDDGVTNISSTVNGIAMTVESTGGAVYGRFTSSSTSTNSGVVFTQGTTQQWEIIATGGTDVLTINEGGIGVKLALAAGGFFGVGGMTAPTSLLTVGGQTTSVAAQSSDVVAQFYNGNANNTRLQMDAFAGNNNLTMRRANNTAASPSALAANDLIGLVAWIGYGASAYSTARATISGYAGENWSATAQGTYLVFSTTANTGTTLAEKARITGAGDMAIGTGAAPASRLDIGAGGITLAEMTAPGAPAANGAIIYIDDNGAGKTRLMVRFNTGAVQQIAIQP